MRSFRIFGVELTKRIQSGFVAGLCLMGTITAGTGCTNALHDDNLALAAQNRELQSRLTDSDGKVRTGSTDSAQLASLQKDIADRDSKIAELQNSLTRTPPVAGSSSPVGPLDPSLSGIETTYDSNAGTLTVNLPGDVLFDSGRASLKSTALSTLDKISAAIKRDYSGKRISVNGFTDSDPITRSKDQWDDNWDLSYGRAKSVAQYLKKMGVNEHMVAIVANGANKPKASKPASRRVEIVVNTR